MAPSPMLQSAMKHGKCADDIEEEVYLGVAIFISGLPPVICLFLCLNLPPLPSAPLLQGLVCHSLNATAEASKGGVSLRKEFL